MRGAPQSEFSRCMRAMSSRTSVGIRGRPPRRRLFQRQYARKPWRCQRSTVPGLDDEDRFPPARPDAGNEDQQGPVSPGELELPAAETATEDNDLVTQRDDLGL